MAKHCTFTTHVLPVSSAGKPVFIKNSAAAEKAAYLLAGIILHQNDRHS